MPTITTADALLTATRDLEETIKGDIPMSQYDTNLVTNFMKLLNAKAKTLQIDEILEARATTEAARAQRVATDAEEEDACLDEEDPQETPPVPDTPAANTRSRAGSGQRTVTQEVMMTMLDISDTGYLLTPRNTASRKFPPKNVQRDGGSCSQR